MDVLLSFNASLEFKEGEVSLNLRRLKREDLREHAAWAKGKNDCGLLDMEPVRLTGRPPPCVKQYPINRAALDGLRPIIKELEERGVIAKTKSASNAPVWPVKKANNTWRLTIDYREANKTLDHICPIVPDVSTIFNSLTPEHKMFTVLDSVNAYWTIPIAAECQDWLAFSFDGSQYHWKRLPQGLSCAPTIYHQALRRHLTLPEAPKLTSEVITYLDDILIASETEEEHDRDVLALLDYLHDKGHKISYEKAQMSQTEVVFLGQKISPGKREITQDRTAAIRRTPDPKTVKELRSFLGLCNYNRSWVECYTEIAQPLNDLLKGRPDSKEQIQFGEEQRKAFEDLKKALCEAPALGIPNVRRPFTLYVNENRGYLTSILSQEHGGLMRPVGYYSAKLDTTALGFGPCLRAIQAVYLAIQLVNNIVLDQQLFVKCPHSVNTLMAGRKVPCVSDSRWGNWQAVLESPNIVIQKATISNPSTMLAPTDTDGTEDHRCEDLVALLEQEHPVKEEPLQNPDVVLFTDGSSLVEDGIRGAGWAVTTEHEVLASDSMTPGTSAQQAELKAMIEALKLAEGKTATVYCDSRYVHGVTMDFGLLWKQRGFVTARGTPIKNGELVAELLDAMQLPKDLAVVKVKAHTRQDTFEARGNALADAASRTAARKREGGDNETTNENGHGKGNTDGSNGNRKFFENDNEKCMMRVTKKVKEEGKQESLANIKDMQNSASREEKWTWIENAAKLHEDNLWRFGTRTVAPESLLPYLATQIHSLGHVGVEKMRNRFIQVWWAPKFTATARDIVKRCVTCRQNNHDRRVKLPMLKTPAPPGPFRVLQIDYITLPKCKGYRDVLIVLCKFSRWIEAFPARSGTALHTAKVLVKDIIPRYGLPEQICSDNGTHFTGAVCAEVGRMLNVQWSLNCPYHPESSGQVERANRTLKERLAKKHQEGIPWVDALPTVLCSMRATSNRDTGLSPFEIVTGRPFSAPGTIDLRKADIHLTSDAMLNYCVQLTEAVQTAANQVKEAWGDPPEGGHSLVPGQWVMIHKPQRLALEAKYDGPYQILLITQSAVKVQGKTKWIHASHCKLVDPPET
ncbi:retrovirus-related Pol polyprotein from transposon 412 [Alosa pseudoharengus]|uniref:retrovirus-related Pol polyprotein from transposon 412 n=1 Tax=Alosa pseudoharengus TaxID=34774 RepID=UPI003F8A6624